LKQALQDRDREKASVLRMLLAALNNQKHAAGRRSGDELTDDEALAVIKSEIKKRKDSVDSYQQAGRPDLAEKEEKEVKTLEQYLPEQMAEDQVRRIVQEVVRASGAKGKSAFGPVMKEVMSRTQGQADGSTVKRIVQEELG